MNHDLIYFDNINTTFPDPLVINEIRKVLENQLGNPSSHIHFAGISAHEILDNSRRQVAAFISSEPDNIIFTSGATESNNLAICGFLRNHADYQLIISSIEHFSIVNQAGRLKKAGIPVTVIDVDSDGLINLDQLENALQKTNSLVSIQTANPEIGTIQDLSAISKLCKTYGAILHSDSTAAAGLVDIDIKSTAFDMLTLSGHNIYGPMGVGALYVSKNIILKSLFDGGNQEFGIRPGTENLPGIAGFGAACEIARTNCLDWQKLLSYLGNKLRDGLAKSVPFIHLTGHPQKRLPGHVSFWVEHIEGESLLLYLNMKKIMASSGSACSSNLLGRDENDLVASHVLSAIGVPSDICAGSITFSLGKYNTESQVDYTLSVMPGIVEKLLAISPSYDDYKKQRSN